MSNFKIDSSKNVVVATVQGFFTEAEAAIYLADYQKTVKTVSPSSYSLIVDAREQKKLGVNVVEDMQIAVNFYLTAGFKKVFITELQSETAMSQVRCLQGIERVTFVKTPEEALELLS